MDLSDVEWNNKGYGLFQLGKFEEAIGCYDKALGINPGCVLAWNNKGRALEALGKPKKAIGCYVQALSIDRDMQRLGSPGDVPLTLLENLRKHLSATIKHLG